MMNEEMTVTYTQGIIVEYDIIERVGLFDAVVYACIKDRLKSSIKSEKFYDPKEQQHYVIYTIKEMAALVHKSERAVGDAFRRLKEMNLIQAKTTFRADKLFVPDCVAAKPNDDAQEADSASCNVQNLHPNQFNNNHVNNTNNTNDTKTADFTKPAQQSTSKAKKQATLEFEALKESLRTKGGLPKHVVDVLDIWSFGNSDKLYEYAGLIYKAKKIVKRDARKVPNSAMATTFEFNEDMGQIMGPTLNTIMANGLKKAKNASGYIMTSLINFFGEQVNDYCQQFDDPNDHEHDLIPMLEL